MISFRAGHSTGAPSCKTTAIAITGGKSARGVFADSSGALPTRYTEVEDFVNDDRNACRSIISATKLLVFERSNNVRHGFARALSASIALYDSLRSHAGEKIGSKFELPQLELLR